METAVYFQRAKQQLLFTGKEFRLCLDFKGMFNLLRGVRDESMRHFLVAAVQYLSEVPRQKKEVPIEVIRALRDVERIVQIEKQALGKQDQDILRFYILQIARLCGENG